MWRFRLTRVRGLPLEGEALGFDPSFRQRLNVLACPRCGRRLTLIALIEDPEVIVRFLGHLELPDRHPEAQPPRVPPLHLVGDAPPTEVAGDQILFDATPLTQPVPRQPARRVPRPPESRLTATPRTGILDTVRSLEACNPRVGDANPPVGEGRERRQRIQYRLSSDRED